MTKLSDFITGNGYSDVGYLHSAIVTAWSDDDLEECHDYIQWLFPLKEASQFTPDAPLITPHDLAAISRANMIAAWNRMLAFYGFQYNSKYKVVVRHYHYWPLKSNRWLTEGNHNYLRITRILKSMMLFGLEDEANAFLTTLENVYREHSELIGETTLKFWQEAVTPEEDSMSKDHLTPTMHMNWNTFDSLKKCSYEELQTLLENEHASDDKSDIVGFNKEDWKLIWEVAINLWWEDYSSMDDIMEYGFTGWINRTDLMVFCDLYCTYIDSDEDATWETIAEDQADLKRNSDIEDLNKIEQMKSDLECVRDEDSA